MKTIKLFQLLPLLLLAVILQSCDRIPEVFTTGGGIGIFAVLAILVVVAYMIMKARRK